MAPLTISSVGFTIPEVVFLTTSVELAAGLDIGDWCYVEQGQADVILFNACRMGLDAAMEAYSASGYTTDAFFISCAHDMTQGFTRTPFLQLPFTYTALVSLLAKLESAMTEPAQPLLEPVAVSPPRPQHAAGVDNISFLASRPPPDSEPVRAVRSDNEPGSGVELAWVTGDENDLPGFMQTDFGAIANVPVARVHDAERSIPADPDGAKRDLPVVPAGETQPQQDRETHILSILKSIIGAGDNVEIACAEHDASGAGRDQPLLSVLEQDYVPVLRIHPQRGLYTKPAHVDLSPALFQSMSNVFSARRLPTDDQPIPDGWLTEPLWKLLFLASLHGGAGQRSTEGIGLQDRLELVAELDGNLLPRYAGFAAVASALVRHRAIDVDAIVNETGLPSNVVIELCTACEDAGLIERIPGGRVAGESAGAGSGQSMSGGALPPGGEDKSRVIEQLRGIFEQYRDARKNA